MTEYTKVEFDMPVIAGYEYTGELRAPKKGEYYEVGGIAIKNACIDDGYIYPILRKKRWRAEKGENYYCVVFDIYGKDYVALQTEESLLVNSNYYERGNYYQTEEEAQEAADKINNIFIGES